MRLTQNRAFLLARLKPGLKPELVEIDKPEYLHREAQPHRLRADALPGSFISIGQRNAVTGQSECGRYLVAISGLYELPAEAHGNVAQWAIEAFRKSDRGFLSRINGTWRAILHDNESGTAWIASDRMGSQRICYKEESDGSLLISSNSEAIVQLTADTLSLVPTSVFQYFFHHCIPSPSSVYTSIRTIGPAEVLTWRGDVSINRYWIPAFCDSQASGSTLTPPELLETLESSVRSVAADKSVGAFLSGGLDSSTVVGMSARSPGTSVNAYTIGFDEKDYDETPYARIAADYYNVPLSVYYATPDDVMTTIEKVATHYDEPFGNSSAIPTFLCAQAAANAGEDIILAGDGGDELFAGNERYQKQQLFAHYDNLGTGLKKSVLEPLFLRALGNVSFMPVRKVRRYIEQARIPMPDRLETYNFLLRDGVDTIFTEDFLAVADSNAPLDHLRAVWDESDTNDLIDKMLYLDWKLTLADNDLRKVTTMCEVAGIDVVYPMLDNRLQDAACRIPGPDKMRGRRLRGFYKEATHDFLPHEVLNKSKHGFGLPFGPWFAKSDTLRNQMVERLDSFSDRNIIRKEYIDSVRQATVGVHPGYFGGMIWVIVILESWLAARPQWNNFRA